jgi:PhnB protein
MAKRNHANGGAMQLITHLSFNGECEAAFKLYAACLEGEITTLLKYSDSPTPYSPDSADKIFHATLKIGDQSLTGVDVTGNLYEKPRGFAVQLNISDMTKAQNIFAAFAEGGVVHMTIQPTSWAEGYGMVTDRFGTPWEINCGNFA